MPSLQVVGWTVGHTVIHVNLQSLPKESYESFLGGKDGTYLGLWPTPSRSRHSRISTSHQDPSSEQTTHEACNLGMVYIDKPSATHTSLDIRSQWLQWLLKGLGALLSS